MEGETARRDDRHHLETELRKANVVVIVYSIEDAQSFDRIAEYWLPTIRSLGINVPCVLVGNKIDLRSAEGLTNEALEAEVLPVMQAYKEIETVGSPSCPFALMLNVVQCVEAGQRVHLRTSRAYAIFGFAVLSERRRQHSRNLLLCPTRRSLPYCTLIRLSRTLSETWLRERFTKNLQAL